MLKIHSFFYKIREIFGLFLFYNVHKENMFTNEIEDREEGFGNWADLRPFC